MPVAAKGDVRTTRVGNPSGPIQAMTDNRPPSTIHGVGNHREVPVEGDRHVTNHHAEAVRQRDGMVDGIPVGCGDRIDPDGTHRAVDGEHVTGLIVAAAAGDRGSGGGGSRPGRAARGGRTSAEVPRCKSQNSESTAAAWLPPLVTECVQTPFRGRGRPRFPSQGLVEAAPPVDATRLVARAALFGREVAFALPATRYRRPPPAECKLVPQKERHLSTATASWRPEAISAFYSLRLPRQRTMTTFLSFQLSR